MDDRQQQVQVGAGLQESRLNTDFIDFLKKYGTYGLYAMLAVVLSYVGWQRWTMHKNNTRDQAFADLGAAIASNNPDTLLKTAADHKGQGAVWQLATLAAAEHYLDSARRGSALPTDPTATAAPQELTEAQTKEMLQKADKLLKDVLAEIGNDKAQIVAAQRARWDLATAALNANDAATAKKYLDEYQAAAKSAGLTDMVAIATMRSASIDRVLTPVKLYASSDLPQVMKPGDAPMSIPGMGQFDLKSGTGGRQINLTMDELEELRKSGQLIPVDGQDPNQPIGTPPPAPAPEGQPVPGAQNENEKPYEPPPSQKVP